MCFLQICLIQCWLISSSGLYSSRAWWPLKPYFFSWATRKCCESYTRHPGFHRFSAQSSLQFFLEHSLAPWLQLHNIWTFWWCYCTIQLKPLWLIKICNLKILLWPVPIRSRRQSCQVNTTSRQGIKQLGISLGSSFLPFSYKSSWRPCS